MARGMLNANVFTNGEGKVAGSESERESRLSAFQSDNKLRVSLTMMMMMMMMMMMGSTRYLTSNMGILYECRAPVQSPNGIPFFAIHAL
jgi:hypothetical protein